MKTVFKPLDREAYSKYADISLNAYTSWYQDLAKQKELFMKRYDDTSDKDGVRRINRVGAYRDDNIVGGMTLYDFDMNLFDTTITVGGIGSVAVDLLHKKEKIARDIVKYSIDYYREKGFAFELLYPFRPDFYKNMGFGYGTKINQYRFKPSDLITKGDKGAIRFATDEDKQGIIDCYNKSIINVHGMISRDQYAMDRMLDDKNNRVVVAKTDGEIRGYLVFVFRKGHATNFLMNDLYISEMVYGDRDTLNNLLTFLKTQGDQINKIVYNTLDEGFHHLLRDVRSSADNVIPHVYHESNVQGVGLMYRIISMEKLFEALNDHRFTDANCRLKLSLKDNIVEDNDGDFFIQFNDGKASLIEEDGFDVGISMDISDFSSLIVGAVDFKELYLYGLAEISDDTWVNRINRIFKVDDKPKCMTAF